MTTSTWTPYNVRWEVEGEPPRDGIRFAPSYMDAFTSWAAIVQREYPEGAIASVRPMTATEFTARTGKAVP